MIQTRTRSRWFGDPQIRAASPLKHKHTVGASRHAPKRRRLGVSSLSVNRLPPSSDTDSNRDMYPLRSRFFPAASPRATSKPARRSGMKRRAKPSLLMEGNEMSPRKRKRSDEESFSLSDTESWVETEDEVPDLIAEGTQPIR